MKCSQHEHKDAHGMQSSDIAQKPKKLSAVDAVEASSLLSASGCTMSPPPETHPYESSNAALFLNAIQDGDLEVVQALIERGVNVESDADQIKMTLILATCMSGHLEIAKFFFAHGARITGVYFHEWISPLYRACRHNHYQVVQWLVENGADVGDVDNGGDAAPIAVAAMHGHLRIVKYLISRGANTTRPIPKRDVSLQHLCAEQGNLGVLKYLVENEIGRYYQKDDGTTRLDDAIKAAVRDGHVEMVQYLLWHPETDAQAITACLYVAIESKQVEIVDLLIKSDAAVNAKDAKGNTPLYFAVHSGLVDVVSILLEHGADINQQASRNGSSAVHEMAQCGQLEMLVAVARLRGAEVDFSIPLAHWKRHPLYFAARCGKTAVVRFLLEQLPIGHLEVVRTLIAYGALIDCEQLWTTPLIVAAEEGHFDVVQYLCENGANVNSKRYDDDVTPVTAAARKRRLDIVEYLLEEHGADVSIRSSNQATVLCEAAARGFCDIVRVLLSHSVGLLASEEDQSDALYEAVFGAKVDAIYPVRDLQTDEIITMTPLMVATYYGHLKIVKYLCENGADVEATTERNENPLNSGVFSGRLELVKYLVEERNVNVDCVDTVYSYSPVDWAKHLGAHDIEQYLQANGAILSK